MYQSSTHSSQSGSITELLSALCDSSLSGVSWKRRALGGVSREGYHRVLKRRAYGALLSKLFQDAGKTTRPDPLARTPARNRVLMICFDLRVAGCREEAERLEEQLERLPDGETSGLKEVDAVLQLLVHLAGSAPPPPTSFSRDYMRRERPVLRRQQPWCYQSEELQRLEARAWGLVCGEEWGAVESLCGTHRLMDAAPGTGLLGLRSRTDTEERFERETRMSLFGALQHSRTSDMDIRLDLPPVPGNIDVTGLAIKVPSCLDQSEDEGFQSSSNLTPDSQSETSPSPEVDIWETLRTFEPGVRRCWETVGCPPGKKESLYLTEGGREAFDQLYRLWEGEMRVVSSSPPSPLFLLPLDSQTQLVTDLLNVLIGVASTTFPLNQSVEFDVRPGVCVSGASPESVARLLGELAQYGTDYLRLSRFSLQSADKKGLVFQAFTGGLRKYLHYYRACVLSTPPTLSLLTISFLFRKVGRQLRYLSDLCHVDRVDHDSFPVVSDDLPPSSACSQTRRGLGGVSSQGVKLLSYLYDEAQNNCSNENYPILLSLLKSSCEPYTRFVSDWVYSGIFRDVYGEFMIQVNEDYLGCRDKNFWVQGYTLISKDVEDNVPVFLRHIANEVYVCGKAINLLKICCPQHYICMSELPAPRIAVTFSLQEVEQIEKDCAVYRGRMERIAKHSATSREEQSLRAERARQELINTVRESAARTLDSIRGRQVSQRLAEEAKKRERFEELKQHLEQEQEWRSAAQKKQEEDDFSYARELRDREKRLAALEEQLEQRARNELIAQYSHLSEEGARRERRAMWRVQRRRLDEARARFFTRDEQQLQALLEQFPVGRERPGGEAAPPVPLLQQTGPQSAPVQKDFESSSSAQCALNSLNIQASSQETEAECEQQPADHEALSPPHGESSLPPPVLSNNSPQNSSSPDGQRVEEALPTVGPDLAQECPTGQLIDYDFSAPFSPLEGITAAQPDPNKKRPSFSHVLVGENVSQVQERLPKPNPFGQASDSSFPLGQFTPDEARKVREETPSGLVASDSFVFDFATIAKPDTSEKDPEGRLENRLLDVSTPQSSQNATDDTSDAVMGKWVSDSANVHMELPLSQAGVGEVHQPEQDHSSHSTVDLVPPHVEVSNSDVKAGVPEGGALPPPKSVHGHASDSHIKVGENVSDIVAALPTPNLHGHASDSHIKVGQLVSEVVDAVPSPSVHGHVSHAHIQVGENVSEVASPLPTANVHGHASDANLKVGEFVSNVPEEKPRWSKHGHASDCTLQIGCVVPGSEPATLPLPGSAHGHSSDSTLGVGCLVSEPELKRSPLPGSTYGHSSDSTLGVGCIVMQEEPKLLPLPGSSHGHSSDSKLGGGCVVSEEEPKRSPLPGSTYGHSSDSTLGVGCVVGQPAAAVHDVGQQNNGSEETSESPAEGAGSWTACLGLSPGEKSEQEYLSALLDQYQVEHYEDCSALMDSSPECQLLKKVTPGPWGLHAGTTHCRATDTTAVQLSKMVSLPVLIKHSVTTPLTTHVSLVNKAVVDYFFVELAVERHFEVLRHFLLMEDGEFAQSLSDRLFEKLGSGQTPGELLTPLVLNSILSKALQYSLHGDAPLAGNFTFALRYLPETFHPHAPDSLNCLELRYKVDWPLNIIITDSCMNKYNRLFSFLLQLKHMVWSLRDVWFHLKRTALVRGAGRSVQFRQLQLYRHEMQHFVKVIQGYIANQILQVSWSEFTAKLAAAGDLDAIHRTHADYLNRAIFRGLLTEKAAPVMNIIHSIFSLILKFRAQLIAQPWSSQQGEAVHPSFIAMQQSYNTFKYYSHFLFKVVTKLVNRGYQPHLEDFLLRINFNNYYKDS
ncbi:gamma-tubulin complex component 6 isoform X1 [Synchiropus splendidus]|uniref:gamma-tubulin complex component 6 isoform X1 n=1 Tax=Synchiropus splendidus TaxID=270530 RepID=UPI00237E5637|nr:gamma-tubulin complex component 6 isoform X1 [Synchiropus splendidus]XP_053741029.1 gamma-tubulin complex component 6 isoform X1 [Synchiropus splendidus]